MSGYMYVLSSGKYKTLYTGVTNDIARRATEHRAREGSVFTKKYHTHNLVYFEKHDRIEDAIERERRVKKWERNWKIELIESINPKWRDLYADLVSL
jgi:putative endonuclease